MRIFFYYVENICKQCKLIYNKMIRAANNSRQNEEKKKKERRKEKNQDITSVKLLIC